MSKESKALTISMLINFIVSAMKVMVGIISYSKSMIADGFYSLSDFITDIIAYFGAKISKKRANKKHPDGYGRIEYVIDIFIATVIFLLGCYTIYNSFQKESHPTSIIWIIVIIFTIILKLINSKYLMRKGLECNSPILITSSRETHDDMISSLGVIVIIIISQFSVQFPILKYTDTIGSLIIGILIIRTSIILFKENIIFLLGLAEQNKEIENKIKEILSFYPEISYESMELVRNGSYYTLELKINILKNFKVYKLLTIESEIRNKIKKLHYHIKFVDINLNHKLSS